MKLKEGMKLKCVRSNAHNFIVGKLYNVIFSATSEVLYFADECNTYWYQYEMSGNKISGISFNVKFEEVKEMFGKKDLKSGMIVENKNGSKAMIVGSALIHEKGGWDKLSSIGECESLANSGGLLNFVRVYKTSDEKGVFIFLDRKEFDDSRWELIWERTDERKQKILDKIGSMKKELEELEKEADKLD